MIKITIVAVALAALPAAPAYAQYGGANDFRTAGSTPPTVERRRSSLPERAAEQSAERRAWRETARQMGHAGYRRAGQAARFMSRRAGVAGEFFANTKTACAPTHDNPC